MSPGPNLGYWGGVWEGTTGAGPEGWSLRGVESGKGILEWGLQSKQLEYGGRAWEGQSPEGPPVSCSQSPSQPSAMLPTALARDLTLGLHPPTADHAQVFAEIPGGKEAGGAEGHKRGGQWPWPTQLSSQRLHFCPLLPGSNALLAALSSPWLQPLTQTAHAKVNPAWPPPETFLGHPFAPEQWCLRLEQAPTFFVPVLLAPRLPVHC